MNGNQPGMDKQSHRDTHPSIAILLGTRNGARFLKEQLTSIAAQTVGRITLYVSDDGSSDETSTILDEFAASGCCQIIRFEGPRKGFAENYRSLLQRAADTHDAYMFSDQDDIWYPNKIERGLELLAVTPPGPAGIGGRTRSMTEAGEDAGFSPLFRRTPAFRNALVQSIAGGNTMILNPDAFRLVRDSSRAGPFVSHDWWAYIIITAAGGQFVYDKQPTISYRQHPDNLVGANSGMLARLRRIRNGLAGTYRRWNDVHMRLLVPNRAYLTEENRVVLDCFNKARTGHLPGRFFALKRSGVYRQTWLSDVNLMVACLLGKL
ncbi:MAG: glycosyltransferase family 2 protein [Hoeflea sp.]|uniref:glycosyltransferase family 2 protein n=1 Tax=Hoeflea sp. TaxID=1940281 RepID=UPI001D1C0DBF|nr:glycosyltransferase family 2 protein [Hoeflea sp.]MBU4529250.1 glycosyltransferase family 2 protein [Alphaproteobacteria bacterium]MBU4543654.1 glycosyltransferase family 2 protein [Alphaproteobacteria bacterium]MBU4549280.1 glycosyltransferase family 2 protein [Alphaproteobacteria bacterium]MBV1725413.1 glycosyltransferase family 2 protein [Hoeflea sp.]MBV1785376.1 glycosyltransferase family 2 protein [Hoeflea sp.]